MGPKYSCMMLGACAALVCHETEAVPAIQHTVLVATRGTDTIAVDRFNRTATTIEGILLLREPELQAMQYTATLAPPEGRFTRMEYIWRNASGEVTRTGKIAFGVDSIRSELKGADAKSFSAPPSLSAIPLPPQPYAAHSYAILEHAAIVLQLATDPVPEQLEWFTPGDARARARDVRRVGSDTITLNFIAGPVRAQVGPDHRVHWMSIGAPPDQVIVVRSGNDIDLAKLMSAFAARDTVAAQQSATDTAAIHPGRAGLR